MFKMFKWLKGLRQVFAYRALNRTTKTTAVLGNRIENLRWEWSRMIGVFNSSFQSLPEEEMLERRHKATEILDKIERLNTLSNIELAKLSILYQDKN
jgi:hypothetical protein